jgi:hypothetical protein
MNRRSWRRNIELFLALFVLLMACKAVEGQSSAAPSPCGKAKVHLDNPVYMFTSKTIIAIEPPPGWASGATRKNPLFFFRSGEKYETARTVMYVRIERLDSPFQSAVERDARTFSEGCQPSRIEDVGQLDILEEGCERKTQIFFCGRKQGTQVDLDTKIAIGGLLINVVLSSDSSEEISRYKKDYEFLLKHLALVN